MVVRSTDYSILLGANENSCEKWEMFSIFVKVVDFTCYFDLIYQPLQMTLCL
jgi:hypothetical protein